MKYIMGIDPGLSGGIALYNPDDREVVTIGMPTLKAGTGSKRIIDAVYLARWVDNISQDVKMCFLERVNAMPKQGVTSSFNFGLGYGIVQGIIAANMIPITMVTPAVWKKATGTPRAKDGALARATQVFPAHSGQWPLKKDDGKAEAALIAWYGANQMQGVKL